MSYNFSSEIKIWNFDFYFLTFDVEAVIWVSSNIRNEFCSYIEQVENSGCSLRGLFREPVVHREIQYNLPHLELQPNPDMGKIIFRMRESRKV